MPPELLAPEAPTEYEKDTKMNMKQISKLVLVTALLVAGNGYAKTKTTITFLHNDYQGSPIKMTDEAGEEDILKFNMYAPYGERVYSGGDQSDTAKSYTGHVEDAESNLTYMQQRYYNPVLGRFMATDPLRFKEDNMNSFNRYAYANNNPYGFVDPDGREGISVDISDRISANFSDGVYSAKVDAEFMKVELDSDGNITVQGGVFYGKAALQSDLSAIAKEYGVECRGFNMNISAKTGWKKLSWSFKKDSGWGAIGLSSYKDSINIDPRNIIIKYKPFEKARNKEHNNVARKDRAIKNAEEGLEYN